MKKLMLVIGLISAAGAMAQTPAEFVKNLEQTQSVKCSSLGTSEWRQCFNYVCKYSQSYTCTDGNTEKRLVLKVKSTRMPGEAAQRSVLSSNYN